MSSEFKPGDPALLVMEIRGLGPGVVVELVEFVAAGTELESFDGSKVSPVFDSWIFTCESLKAELGFPETANYAFAPSKYLMPLRADPHEEAEESTKKNGEPA